MIERFFIDGPKHGERFRPPPEAEAPPSVIAFPELLKGEPVNHEYALNGVTPAGTQIYVFRRTLSD